MTTLAQDVSLVLRIAIREQRLRRLWHEPIDERRLDALARALQNGEIGLYRTSTGHEVGHARAALVTIDVALRSVTGDGSCSAQSYRRKVRRWVKDWAEQGLIRAQKRGKTWFVDPDELRTMIGDQAA